MDNETQDIMSPEGVEERMLIEMSYRITLTVGGKYRAYALTNKKEPVTIGVFNTREEADMAIAQSMVIMGSIKIDPKLVVDMLLRKP